MNSYSDWFFSLQILFNKTHRPSADPPAPTGQRRSERRLLRPEERRRRERQQLLLVDEHRIVPFRSQKTHHPSLDVPDGSADVVQQSHETNIRRDTKRERHPGTRFNTGVAVISDGQSDAEDPHKEPADERNRAVARVLRQRLVHVEVASGQDPDSRGERRVRT